jgi:hypothetical protein
MIFKNKTAATLIAFFALVAIGSIGALIGTNVTSNKKHAQETAKLQSVISNLQGNGNGNQGSGNGNGGPAPVCASTGCGSVAADLGAIYRNAIKEDEAGGYSVIGSMNAVGNNEDRGRIVVVANGAIALVNKATGQRVAFGTTDAIWPPTSSANPQIGYPYVIWDRFIERFWIAGNGLLLRHQLFFTAPAALVSASPMASRISDIGPTVFSVTGSLVASVPADGCTPFTNAGAVSGNIAFIIRGACSFGIKITNAQAAGARAVLVYNNAANGDGIVTMVCPTCTGITIPSVFIGYTNGLLVLSNIPGATVRIESNATIIWNTNAYLAVSTTASPNSLADFVPFDVVTPTYSNNAAHYIKLSVSADAVYLSSPIIGNMPAGTNFTSAYYGANVLALDKNALLTSATVTPFFDTTVVGQSFLMPTKVNTPITDPNEPVYLVGFGPGSTAVTTLNVYLATAAGLNPSFSSVALPTPIDVSPQSSLARQPNTIPMPVPVMDAYTRVMTAVVFQDSLFAAFSYNASGRQVVVRWVELNISTTAVDGVVRLVQWSDINLGSSVDTYYPHLDVNKNGDLAIGFSVSGNSTFFSAGYIVRAKNDPLNTLRYPATIALRGQYQFLQAFAGTDIERDSTNTNRVGDQSGMDVDPVDGLSFYGCNGVPDSTGFFSPPNSVGYCNSSVSSCVARQWVVSMYKFNIDKNLACPANALLCSSQNTVTPPSGPRPPTKPCTNKGDFDSHGHTKHHGDES